MDHVTWTDVVVAVSSGMTALLTLGLLVAALLAWKTARVALDASKAAAQASRHAAEQAERSVKVMEADSHSRSLDSVRANRPYVLLRLAPSLAGIGAWDLVVENLGASAAYGIRLAINGSTLTEDDVLVESIEKLAAGDLMLPPGGRLRSIWYLEPDEHADPSNGNGYEWAEVTARYQDGDGNRYDNDPPVTLDPVSLGLTPVPRTGAEARGKNAEMRDIAHALRAIASNLGEIAR